MSNIAIFISGDGTNLKSIVEKISPDVNVSYVFSNSEKADGVKYAESKGIRTIAIDSKKYYDKEVQSNEMVRLLGKQDIDLIVLAGYMEKIPEGVLSKYKVINLHPSLLPKHKGLKAIEKSFEDNSHIGGISYHWCNNKIDDGDLVEQFEITKRGDINQYNKDIKKAEHSTYYQVIEKVLGIRTQYKIK